MQQEFSITRGSCDPRKQTCRSKLQSKRSKLNREINKELMLRTGAENLYRATSNKKLKETVALELSFMNSNLQLLKERLCELNSDVQVYQNSSQEPDIPLIPLGMRETKVIDVEQTFKEFIRKHYKEDADEYDDAIAEFVNLRQSARFPSRDHQGIALLFKYLNQLYYVERRFFPACIVFFEWYDSLTGIPSCQRSVAFERASILFNIGALYTQMGARQDRSSCEGLSHAIDSFLRAAGVFQHVSENYANAPSMDLCPEVLGILVRLMMAQARECLLAKLDLARGKSMESYMEMVQEAAQTSAEYSRLQCLASLPNVVAYLPHAWRWLLRVKKEHYAGYAHQLVTEVLLDGPAEWQPFPPSVEESLRRIASSRPETGTFIEIDVPRDAKERQSLGRAHLRCAIQCHEEALRLHHLCRLFRKQSSLLEALTLAYDTTTSKYSLLEKEDDFQETLDAPPVAPSCKYPLIRTPPDFGYSAENDPFRRLGPVAVFSAHRQWSSPRTVCLHRFPGEDFGFTAGGDSPVRISEVRSGSLAELRGVQEGDVIVSVASVDAKWMTQKHVADLIRDQGDSLVLSLVTLSVDSNPSGPECGGRSAHQQQQHHHHHRHHHHLLLPLLPSCKNALRRYGTPASTTSSSSSSGVSSLYPSLTETQSKHKTSWNLFKRYKDKNKSLSNIQEASYLTSAVFS